MRIHLVAVSGTGMGALAGLLKQLGHDVQGSDVRFDPPMGPALEAWGVRCLEGFDPKHLDPDEHGRGIDRVIIGNVCRRDNPEAVAAFERGLSVLHIASALRELVLAEGSSLVVAGTHGKTTTTALTAFLLDRVGYQPGFLIGGLPRDFETSARPLPAKPQSLPILGGRKRKIPFVIEGDEYDTAFFEKTAKFHHYDAECAILTSIEQDHIDIYPTFDAYVRAFEIFVSQLPENGLIVAYAGDPVVVDVVRKHARAQVSWYALSDDDPHGMPVHWMGAPAPGRPEGTSFDVFAGGVAAGAFHTQLVGRYNVRNCLAALAIAAEGYGAPLDRLRGALGSFKGVCRRQQVIGSPRGIEVIDDFAHHPTAVRETLAALRTRVRGAGRLIAVFEPRSATACRKLHQTAYESAFTAADLVVIAPLGRQNLPPEERLDVPSLIAALRHRGQKAEAPEDLAAILSLLADQAKPGDVIALLSNGAFGGIHGQLLARLGA
jgi:UDP-N-acetylmuramate: L-alanyl-gamma-D-glutamyl-meso-diaminopimelate ligase